MNLKQILYFLQIYRDESFTKAAANLAVSQPALSLQIANLEKELGFSLLERGTGKIKVTDKGNSFLIYAVDILDSFHNLENALAQKGIPDQLVISAGGAICGWVLPNIVAGLRANQQALKIQILEGDRNFVKQSLLTGRSDFAILTETINDSRVESVYFCSDKIVPVISSDQIKPHNMDSLLTYPFLLYHSGSSIQKVVGERLEQLKIFDLLNVVMEIRSLNSLLKCVEAGIGIGFISNLSISDKVQTLEFENLHCPRKFYIHYRKKRKAALQETARHMSNIAQHLDY
jgi:LysR family transcriptional activator of glutamate synthase operon